MKKLILILIALISATSILIAQTAIIKGTVIDEGSGESLPFVNVILKQGANVIQGATTDFDGKYELKVKAGIYDLEVTYVGYPTSKITNINAKNDSTIIVDVFLEEAITLDEIVVIGYSTPMVEKSNSAGSSVIASSVTGINVNNNKQQSRRKRNKQTKPEGNTEDYDAIVENEYKEVTNAPLSTFSIDVDNAAYSTIRRQLEYGDMPDKNAIRIEEMINYFSYDYKQPTGKHPFSIYTEVSDCPWNKKHHLVHIGLQGKKMNLKNAPNSNLVFLIDVSGSMSTPNKLGLLQESLELLVDNLREEDKVAIVVYAGAAGLVLPPTSGVNKEKIKKAIYELEAGGSTAGGAGIELAYKVAKEHFIKKGNNRVILATDGDFNVGTSSKAGLTSLIKKKRKDDIFLTVLGFGMGNYKDNTLELLANKGNGNYAYIDNIKEAKKVLVSEMGGTLYTIAKDVKLQIEFNPAFVDSYRLIGYENRLLNDEDFNDDTKDAGELGAGHTVTAIYEIIPKGSKTTNKRKVDALKYQNKTINSTASTTGEMMTIKFRYKKPRGIRSKLLKHTVYNKDFNSLETSNDFRFSASVAGFGLLLRDSKFKGNLNYEKVIKLAEGALGEDKMEYRTDFLELVEEAMDLQEEMDNASSSSNK